MNSRSLSCPTALTTPQQQYNMHTFAEQAQIRGHEEQHHYFGYSRVEHSFSPWIRIMFDENPAAVWSCPASIGHIFGFARFVVASLGCEAMMEAFSRQFLGSVPCFEILVFLGRMVPPYLQAPVPARYLSSALLFSPSLSPIRPEPDH